MNVKTDVNGFLKRVSSLSWVAVILVALALSNYSLAIVGHHFGLPYLKPLPLAWMLSIPFDGAALIAGDLTLRYARELGSNGTAPRAVVVILAGLSAWLNSAHASFLGLGYAAHIMYACPPVVAVVLFELHTHYEYRTALQRAGRTVEPLPAFGASAWALHFPKGLKAVSAITGHRMDMRAKTEMTRVSALAQIERAGHTADIHTQLAALAVREHQEQAEVEAHAARRAIDSDSRELDGIVKRDAIGRAFRELGLTAPINDVTDWLKARGITAHRSYISAIRSDMTGDIDIIELDKASPVQDPHSAGQDTESKIIKPDPTAQDTGSPQASAPATRLADDSLTMQLVAQPGQVVVLTCSHSYTATAVLRMGDRVMCPVCRSMREFPGIFAPMTAG